MIRSMTGFGHSEGNIGAQVATVEARSVNHRFFTSTIKVPSLFSRSETEIRELLRASVVRGHVSLTVRLERSGESRATINHERFAAALSELRMLQQKYSVAGDIDMATVLRMPDVLSAAQEEEPEAAAAAPELLELVARAIAELNRARESEGARLKAVLMQRLDLVEQAVARIVARAPERLVAHRDRLRSAVRELADGLTIDETRLAQEVALMADRLDIAEESDRFRSHLVAFRTALSGAEPGVQGGAGAPVPWQGGGGAGSGAGGGKAGATSEGAGKRLGFLLQEMLRETNTMGSKAADPDILHEVVGMKEELERIREQVENLE